LILGALAATGCGGGGASSTTSTAASGATTSTTGSGFGSGSGQGFDPNNIPKSASSASSAYFNALVQAFSQSGKLSTSQAEAAAHCIQDGLTKAGFKTQGDAEGPNTKKALEVIFPCVQKAQSQ
jgi:ABC-type transport system substrate-binding protein